MSVVVGMLVAVASAIGAAPSGVVPTTVPADRAALQADVNLAQRVIDDPSSSGQELASAGAFEQLATQDLARRPRAVQRATIAGLEPPSAAAMRADLDAASALARLNTPRRSLPPWRIVQPPPPQTLLGYFKSTQARFHVPWQYLAAIEFVETKFGRIHGLSIAGADGPMQFMPATWARYGRGDVHDQRAAIEGAARYLTANGAPHDMADALYHYNPSIDYVRSVSAYANHMRSDPRAYYGYYWWQVILALRDRRLILPVGYPKTRPVRVKLPAAPRSG
ncbi:MAG TPA: lytic transglycosylase domain-containing protein [Solirubrobacteraceae bacterium]|nr:lytic transglycosylase domain-containing protein [Solirubrobacteraceae bacterium]